MALRYIDIAVIEGHRTKEEQNAAFARGASKVKWPDGKHNKIPSLAVDLAPAPVEWSNEERFIYMAGIIMGIASLMGVKLRWGGDWNQDTNTKDETFRDLGHFELVEER